MKTADLRLVSALLIRADTVLISARADVCVPPPPRHSTCRERWMRVRPPAVVPAIKLEGVTCLDRKTRRLRGAVDYWHHCQVNGIVSQVIGSMPDRLASFPSGWHLFLVIGMFAVCFGVDLFWLAHFGFANRFGGPIEWLRQWFMGFANQIAWPSLWRVHVVGVCHRFGASSSFPSSSRFGSSNVSLPYCFLCLLLIALLFSGFHLP